MTNTTKIVFLGASSASFGLSMFRDLFASPVLAGSTLTLVGRNPETLGRMTELAKLMNARSGAGLIIEQTTDRRAALDGAGFVINATAIDRNRLWKQDFEVPKKHGIRHTLGENGGPGGLFFTLRTLPLVFDFIRDIEELCPTALFLNYSNPESRIILALGRYTKVRHIGLCHGIFMGRDAVAYIMQMPREEIEVWGAGLNHFQCLTEIRHRDTGEDLYPRFRAAEQSFDPDAWRFTRRLYRAFGYWLTCSDDHLGEYLPYGWEAGEKGYDFDQDERWRGEFLTQLNGVLGGTMPIPQWWTEPSGERGAAVIAAMLHNQKRFIESGIVINRGVIPNLPAELAVEVPVTVDAAGVHPVSLGPLPDPIAKLMLMQASVQQLAVEAAVHASKELALQALLIDPVVNSAVAAEKILDELWEINRPYIRKCV
ncbi:alpha-glucosidase/alpha-galactosidase [Rhodopseudomonas palustris]|uniref:Alpha-D-galactoside galactohydrolase n=1 Tax=Rhodopseudomonas palustris (strain ATCC BAA-98 / CGA009) TaxID=258594 RepID=Q6NCU1_RHOPA|nr:alpha-glucosidase/alpha-galactosidase [Rhodopseudomonas palustris]OPF93259.1 alpha-glucosidase/alpha-galactosidase [Rhodopseudomonas palustris]PPQ42709.1 alpha-glucosidase/alpha-galactosidase [Rhodopseudomonas palustris]QQM01876.1 Alpha-glucosidase [Rhodopseudomonas palustris]RJF64670.1 alpha-glucosidase/alpha-galactosidase [Rhodopseudomonas palustris]WAB78090.1 alpha-glucosidase/alpha-galactosidase [Rhodopseudomonas palustris]